MEHVIIPVPDGSRVFRLAYASRMKGEMEHGSVVNLADEASVSNRRNHVSGVLFSGQGVFLQWLEGPADDVCSLMSRISADPRHHDVTVLSAGWTHARRFPRWPMQLAEPPLADGIVQHPRVASPYNVDCAMIAFDRAADDYRQQAANLTVPPSEIIRFAECLITCDSDALPMLPPPAQGDLRARAQLVDDVCATFAQGWQADRWSSTEIVVGLVHLNRLWQRAGRVAEPVRTRHDAAIVVPPGSREVLGAIVKADLLRASGTSVRLVLEAEAEATFAAVSQSDPSMIIVPGPRVGLSGDAARAAAFAERLHARFPGLPIHLGGRASGPLCDLPDRFGFRRDVSGAIPARNVEWLALRALADLRSRST